jgi:hypothetical protein
MTTPIAVRRRWPWLVAGLTAGLLVGLVAGAAAFPVTRIVVAPPVQRTVTVTLPPETVTVPAPVPGTDPTLPTTVGAGVWEVGVDMAPGKYKTAGTDGYGCYHARLRTGDGSLADILANGFSQGPVTVVVRDSDGYFETSGCHDWIRVG